MDALPTPKFQGSKPWNRYNRKRRRSGTENADSEGKISSIFLKIVCLKYFNSFPGDGKVSKKEEKSEEGATMDTSDAK